MAFKKIQIEKEQYENIESLFRDLNSRGIESLYSHQADILRQYHESFQSSKDVAIELPTGSGKTLIGLLIGEYHRKVKSKKVIYLCPTKQLVKQIAKVANEQYGIQVTPFVGSKHQYSQKDKFSYLNAETIAITTYSSLFNVKPFFSEPDYIVLDDSHNSENYIGRAYSLAIERSREPKLFNEIIDFMSEDLDDVIRERMTSDICDPYDQSITQIFPNQSLVNKIPDLISIIDNGEFEDENNRFNWRTLKNNLNSCNMFFNYNQILIRPWTPPTSENRSFAKAAQRIYMSATLGNGGDLERGFGISKIDRIPLPEGWKNQGNGRRYFSFPNMSLDNDDSKKFITKAIKQFGRTVIIVSSNESVTEWENTINIALPNFEVFHINNIEDSKDAFLESDQSVLIMANRLDGIDFPGDECRLLIIDDLSHTANLQEDFLMSRADAASIYFDRNRTRLVQAIGRTTRSPKDYSAVIVTGDRGLCDWFYVESKNVFFHPELQAELKFAIDNSSNCDLSTFSENLTLFKNQGEEWREVIDQIVGIRNSLKIHDIPGETQLSNAVEFEVSFSHCLWNKDLDGAIKSAREALDCLSGGTTLKGYRAFWKFQLSNAYWQKYLETKNESFKRLARKFQEEARDLAQIFRFNATIEIDVKSPESLSDNQLYNSKRALSFLESQGLMSAFKFNKYLERVKGLATRSNIEQYQVNIGRLLGFLADKSEASASPDPYWISNQNLVFVFEDKIYDKEEGYIRAADIRQCGCHKEWIKLNIKNLVPDVEIISVLLTNRKAVDPTHVHLTNEIMYWDFEKFISWSKVVIKLVRNFQSQGKDMLNDEKMDLISRVFLESQVLSRDIIGQLTPLVELAKGG